MTAHNQLYWEERWHTALADSPMHRRSKKGGDAMQRWNKMAGDFAERTGDKENVEKREKTLLWLRQSGALFPGAKIIDIGAGPGNCAISLAKAGADVTALEPAEGMVQILSRRMNEEGVNVSIRQATWQEIDLDAEGWRGAFDLVFASMTPGVDGPAMLHKMMAATKVSGGFCYLSAFAGRNWQEWYGDLWRTLFAEELNGHINDIIYPFNLVYAMGYRPELRFDSWDRHIAWTRDKAIADFTTYIESYTELTDDVQSAIAAHVDGRCRDGIFQDTRSGCRGMMVWNMQNQIGNNRHEER
ncbi:MAG: class I SAM-dependent methyltransferase [Desulfopila sp.]